MPYPERVKWVAGLSTDPSRNRRNLVFVSVSYLQPEREAPASVGTYLGALRSARFVLRSSAQRRAHSLARNHFWIWIAVRVRSPAGVHRSLPFLQHIAYRLGLHHKLLKRVRELFAFLLTAPIGVVLDLCQLFEDQGAQLIHPCLEVNWRQRGSVTVPSMDVQSLRLTRPHHRPHQCECGPPPRRETRRSCHPQCGPCPPCAGWRLPLCRFPQ